MKVLCTVAIILGSGYRTYDQYEGKIVNEGTKGYQERVLVDFNGLLPLDPQARWVDENACLYMENPDYTEEDETKDKSLAIETIRSFNKKWQTFKENTWNALKQLNQ